MARPESFHTPGDGRGYRKVFVNGNEIDRVVWCDVAAGIVVFMPSPLRFKKKPPHEFYTRRLRGVVTVEPDQGLS